MHLTKVRLIIQIEVSVPQNASLRDVEVQNDGSVLIESSPSIQQKQLFGTAPSPGEAVLYALYASDIATILWTTLEGMGLRRNVVVGVALKPRASDGAQELSMEKSIYKGIINMIIKLLDS